MAENPDKQITTNTDQPGSSGPVEEGKAREFLNFEEEEEPEPKTKKLKLNFQVMKAIYYQELLDLKRIEDYERKTMDREIQDVLDKHKLERKEFLMKQKRELEEFNGENLEAVERFQDNQRQESERKEISFEEERREIAKRNEPRRKAIHKILLKRENIEKSLLDFLLQEKGFF